MPRRRPRRIMRVVIEVPRERGQLRVLRRFVEAWAAALRRLWTEEELRADLRARGLERAATYTWERAARETWTVYRQVVG